METHYTTKRRAITNQLHLIDYVGPLILSNVVALRLRPPRRHRAHKGPTDKSVKDKSVNEALNKLSYEVIGAALEVHRTLGPGLLESSYRKCLCRELFLRNVPFQNEWPLPLTYKGLQLDCNYKMDIVVAKQIVIEVKSVEVSAPIHDAQLLTYLRIGGYRLRLLINFNVEVLKTGIRRKILGYE